jgi:pyruvate/2-oxoglutarate dehydrogenase complex dihydrolipoamide acyltransferase (E2) component
VPNVKLKKLKKATTFRKMAMGTWRDAKDPTVYGEANLDMTNVYKYLDEYQSKHNVKITPGHLVGRAITYCLKRRPELNGMIRNNQIYLRENISLFYQVNIPGEGADKIKKANLAGTVIHKTEEMNLAQISQSLYKKATAIKEGRDQDIKKNMDLFKFIPWSLTGLYLNFVSWLMYGLNIDLSFLGVPKDPFGSVMITNIGGLGIDFALAPLVPYSRVPLLLTVGAVSPRPWVVDGKVEPRPILPIGVTFDHRLIDGIHGSQMAKDLKQCFDEPEKYLFNDELEF